MASLPRRMESDASFDGMDFDDGGALVGADFGDVVAGDRVQARASLDIFRSSRSVLDQALRNTPEGSQRDLLERLDQEGHLFARAGESAAEAATRHAHASVREAAAQYSTQFRDDRHHQGRGGGIQPPASPLSDSLPGGGSTPCLCTQNIIFVDQEDD